MDNMSVFLGTVVSTAPEYGIAIVDVMGGAEQQTRTLIGYLPCNDSATGTVTHQIIPTGSTVICASIHEDDEVTYIISQANYMVADVDNSLLGRANYDIGSIVARDYTAIDTVLIQLLQDRITFLNNHAHNMDIDAMTGDFDVRDYDGEAGIHIGKYISQLRGSSMAYIDLAGISDRIRMVASTIEQHTPTMFTTVKNGIHSSNVAINATEAFGILNGDSPIELKDDIPELKHQDAIPLYRLQKKTGDAVGGEEDIIVIPPKEAQEHTSETEPIIVAKKRTAFNGAISAHSANSILSMKSPSIVALHQVAYDEEMDPPQGDILIPYDKKEGEESSDAPPTDLMGDENKDDEKIEEAIRDAALNKIVESIISEEYLDKLLEKLSEHGLKLASTEKTLDKTFLEQGQSVVRPTSEAAYKAPFGIDIVDQATGETTRYYKSTSFISQEDDGSILIKDGYGSEIRMSQGNIYISPALDLFFRPGRDLSAMVPRHQAFNSQYTCTFNSGSTYIRSTEDLKMVAGTAGAGALTIENKGTGTIDEKVSGINIKSANGLALTGTHVYIGGKSGKGTAKKSISNDESRGSVVIDAGGGGSILTRSATYTAESSQIVLLCYSGITSGSTGSGSAITIADNLIGLYTSNVLMPANLSMRGIKGTEAITIYNKGTTKTVKLKTVATPALEIAGSIGCYSNALFKKGIVANGVASIMDTNAMVRSSLEESIKYFNDIELISDPVIGAFGKSNASAIAIAAEHGPYQDWFVNGSEFSFPTTYNVDISITVPGMSWQKEFYDSDNFSDDYTWSEEYIKDSNDVESACYPGIDIWEKASLSLGKDKDNKTIKVDLKSSYVTTTPKKKRN